MPITIPNRKEIRLSSDFARPQNGRALAAMLATIAMTNPGPIMVDTDGVGAASQARCKPASGSAGADGYIGYNPDPYIPAGGAVSPCQGILVHGFSGVLPGKSVFIDATNADASGTASGLTHTQPTTAVATSGGVEATGTITIAGTPHTGDVVTVTVNGTAVTYTVLVTDTTVTLIAAGVVAALAANGTVAALVTAANVAGVITLTAVAGGTAGNAVTTTTGVTGSGATTTSTASGGTLTGGRATAETVALGTPRIGVGWSTTAIFFF